MKTPQRTVLRSAVVNSSPKRGSELLRHTLPHFVLYGIPPNASKQVVEFGIFSRQFLDTIDEINASFGKKILKWTSGENSNYFVGEITFVNFENELPKPIRVECLLR